MNWSSGLSWWSALTRATPDEQRAGADDPADMGTAFGLDASFGPIGDPPPLVRGALPAPSSLPWEHRLTRRSGL